MNEKIEELMSAKLPKLPSLHMVVKVDGKLCSDTKESIIHAMINELPITFNKCFIAEKTDGSNTFEVDIESIEIIDSKLMDTNLPEADKRLVLKEKENIWDNINDFLIVLRAALTDRQWSWVNNPNCKYVDLRVDMRNGGCIIMNREHKRIDPEHLRYQHFGAGHELHDLQVKDDMTTLLEEVEKYLETDIEQDHRRPENVYPLLEKVQSLLKKRKKVNLDDVEKL